jgi:hypothetical protein
MAAKLLIGGSIARAAYGICALLLPKTLAGAAGEDGLDDNARYFNRLFGGRDLVVAGVTIAAVKRGAEREGVTVNLLCEITDSIALVEELRERRTLDRTLRIALAFNAVGYATWLRAARSL